MEIILASSSKQRQEILEMIGLKYKVVTSDIDEISTKEKPDEYVEELSLNKAKSVATKISDKAIIIAADTIIYYKNKIYEKPKSPKEAANNLKELSGNVNSAYTGVTILDLYQNKTISFSSKVDIYFKKVEDDEIEWYINHEDKIMKTCGYVPKGKAALFIEKIEGDYNTLLGLSPSLLFQKLKELGYTINDLIC